MDLGPEGHQLHPPEIRLSVREAGQHSGTVRVGVRLWSYMGRGRVFHHDEHSLASSSFNDSTGDVHKRHRRAMTPAFGLVEAKGLLPCFMETVNKARELRLNSILKADSGP